MEIRKYTAPDGREFTRLPGSYNGVYHITEANMAALGWTVRTENIDVAVTSSADNAAREAAYDAFAEKLNGYAADLGIDLKTLDDSQVTIAGLTALAQEKGVTDAKLQKMQNALMVLAFECMAQSGLTWARTWAEIKRNLTAYLAD